MFKRLLYHPITAFLWTVLIFIGCSLPGKEIPKVGLFDNFDKVVHFTFFFVFVWLWYRSQKLTLRQCLIIAIIYGFGLEWYQLYFVAGRSFDVWDGVADSIGALTAALVFKRK